jgi:riboflavin biosynthesis pyrimidine reductase
VRMQPLELLYEPSNLPSFELPEALAALYPGSLGFDSPRLFANFVETVDGVVAIPTVEKSNKLIAAGSAADRFVMGLLRACADAVLVGAGTLGASPGGMWTPEQAFPDAAADFDALRAGLGLSADPEIVILSASGAIDPAQPLFQAGALVLTTDVGRALIGDRLPGASSVVSLGPGSTIDPTAAVGALRARGHRLLLHEGGPHVIGSFFAAGVVDELFLTISPLLTGRTMLDPRLALVEGADLLPGVRMRLLGVRRDADHLFVRYGILPR